MQNARSNCYSRLFDRAPIQGHGRQEAGCAASAAIAAGESRVLTVPVREAALAAVAIQKQARQPVIDCFASPAMTEKV